MYGPITPSYEINANSSGIVFSIPSALLKKPFFLFFAGAIRLNSWLERSIAWSAVRGVKPGSGGYTAYLSNDHPFGSSGANVEADLYYLLFIAWAPNYGSGEYSKFIIGFDGTHQCSLEGVWSPKGYMFG